MAIVATMGAAAGLVWFAPPAAAQRAETFTTRLTWVPTSGANRGDVAGRGTAAATLSGTTLSFTGSFDGLAAPATVARLHRGAAIGARGLAAVIGDLTVTKAASGTLAGSLTLTPQQIEDLRAGKLYIQVHSEKGVEPDGSTLWGWLVR
jgi:hypothetical protein